MNRLLVFPLGVALLTLAACGAESSGQAAEAPDPDNVVAQVNGEPISAVALDAQIQALASRGGQGQAQSVQPAQALDQLVDLQLLSQKAEEAGLHEQPEIAAEIARQRSALLAQRMIRAEVSDFEVSEDDLRQAYREQTENSGGTEFRASHILLESEDEAADIISQLDDGAEFGELAREHSTGPTAERDGDLGWFQPDQMVAPFSEAVGELEPGDYSGEPVETQFGWHVIQLNETRDVEPPAFEEMEQQLRNEMVREHIQDYLASLRDDAEVEINDSSLQGDSSQLPAAADQQPANGGTSAQ
ncbi:MAG: peptidylprolyl isomerase [Halofilum sp. (in: g-proteobacteria)]